VKETPDFGSISFEITPFSRDFRAFHRVTTDRLHSRTARSEAHKMTVFQEERRAARPEVSRGT
jgi:hypothetical protein